MSIRFSSVGGGSLYGVGAESLEFDGKHCTCSADLALMGVAVGKSNFVEWEAQLGGTEDRSGWVPRQPDGCEYVSEGLGRNSSLGLVHRLKFHWRRHQDFRRTLDNGWRRKRSSLGWKED